MEEKRDYCTCFPEYIENIYIGNCCRRHDNQVGEAGTFNPVTPHIDFYNDLRALGVSKKWSVIITLGGTVFSLVKYPYFVYKKIKYRRK